MTAEADAVQLLRFLTQEAKVPLAQALPKCNVLRQKGITSAESIALQDVASLTPIFGEEKVAKQVYNAAKRKTSNLKKRTAPDDATSSKAKHTKTAPVNEEDELTLPISELSIDELRSQTVETNRAPLFLAFSVTVAKYTLPDQPLSSRLSLAQAVTSAGAQSKAKYIGLTDSTAEDDGWAQGQPKIKLMGREIAVMRRHVPIAVDEEDADSQKTVDVIHRELSREAFWGIDLEALKRTNGPLIAEKASRGVGPPIHTAKGARAYLLKSIDLVEVKSEDPVVIKTEDTLSPKKPKKLTPADRILRKEKAVGMLLKAIDHVCQSWASTLSADDLDRRAGAWYTRTRPEVEAGQQGWGQRGQVHLRDILALARDQ